ncbi:MAG: PAS domain S-box protein [Desulfovibrionaceae bacterium]
MAHDSAKSRSELLEELASLRERVAMLEARTIPPSPAATSESTVQRFFDAIPNPVFFKDSQGVFTACNKAFAAFLGLGRETVIGKTIEAIAPGPMGQSLHANDLDFMAKRGSKVYESRLKAQDGKVHDLLVNLATQIDDEGAIVGMGGIITDITDLKRIQRALRDAEANYRSFVENASEGVFRTTRDGRFVSINPSMVRLTGHANVGDFLTAYQNVRSQLFVDPKDCDALLNRLRLEKQVELFEARFYRHDKQVVWASLSAHTVCDEHGGIIFIEGSCRDITARKRAERRLDVLTRHLKTAVKKRTLDLVAANKRLTELDAMKSSFLSTVSHDLRTPLTSILGFSKIIRKDFNRYFLAPAQEDALLMQKAQRITGNLDIISREGERLARLVNDFLDLSKIEAGQMQWNDSEIKPHELVRLAVDAMSGQMAEKPGLKLKVEVDSTLNTIFADPDRILQVLVNLLHNAFKFTDTGWIIVSAAQHELGLHLTVEDTGTGIPHEDQPQVFNKFNQVRRSDTISPMRGTGLGLAICKEIVTHYNGRIDLSSEPGKGSRFTVVLPRVPDTAPVQ